MRNFHINWNGDPADSRDDTTYETPVGTHFRFLVNDAGQLIMRRVIPVRFISAY